MPLAPLFIFENSICLDRRSSLSLHTWPIHHSDLGLRILYKLCKPFAQVLSCCWCVATIWFLGYISASSCTSWSCASGVVQKTVHYLTLYGKNYCMVNCCFGYYYSRPKMFVVPISLSKLSKRRSEVDRLTVCWRLPWNQQIPCTSARSQGHILLDIFSCICSATTYNNWPSGRNWLVWDDSRFK